MPLTIVGTFVYFYFDNNTYTVIALLYRHHKCKLKKLELNKTVHINVREIMLKNSLFASNPSLFKDKLILHLHKYSEPDTTRKITPDTVQLQVFSVFLLVP